MARFALFTNGVKVETLDELKENFNITNMLENYRNKALHRWLMVNRMTGELSQVEAITATEDNAVIDELVKIFEVPAGTIEDQKRVHEEEARKKEEVLSALEKEQLTDIEKTDFLKYMDESSDPQNIIALLQKHAGRGNPVAQLKLGWCFENEKGVEKNTELAVEWYKKSTEQGLARAQNQLGVCFHNGNGVTKDKAQAVFWYQKSADQDFSLGLCNLGRCYQYGSGVEKNPMKAVELYQRASEQNCALGQYLLGICCYYGEGVEKNYAQAAEWYQKSADGGNAEAKRALGLCYRYGSGVEKDIHKAIELYTAAADRGDNLAMGWLGDIFFENEDELFDTEKALMWYKKAAEAGDKEAILKEFEVLFYNSLFEYGLGVLDAEALNALLEAYNKKIPGAGSFICFFKYMQYSFEKNSLQKDADFERVIKFLTENCSDFDDSIEAWCSALLSESADDICPALLVLGMLIINVEEGGDDLSEIIVGTAFDKSDAKAFLEKAAEKNYRLAKKVLTEMELYS